NTKLKAFSSLFHQTTSNGRTSSDHDRYHQIDRTKQHQWNEIHPNQLESIHQSSVVKTSNRNPSLSSPRSISFQRPSSKSHVIDTKHFPEYSNSNSFDSIYDHRQLQRKDSNGYVPRNRFVHFDLKGAPPKISYLRKIFPLIRKAGGNGILLEYEDMFPFDGRLKHAAANNAFTKNDIYQIKSLARANQLEIIPLVQTFGHLEFILKLEVYRHLRESDSYPQTICPSKNESSELLFEMIDQVLALHKESKWLHIGCDEVFQIGLCNLCQNQDINQLFLNHVKSIASYVNDRHQVIPIIWDDMLRQIYPETIKLYELHRSNLEIMIWTYIDDIYRFIPYGTWISYSQSFPKIWGASAFKGAFGETLTAPNIKMHLDNNIAWLGALEEQSTNFKTIQGLVITGWQRYDHLATLCELLPTSLPSLILDLLTVSNGKYESRLIRKLYEILNCGQNVMISNENIFSKNSNFFHLAQCDFPGSKILQMINDFEEINKRVDDFLYDLTVHKAWLTRYNFAHNITSPWRINEGLQNYPEIMYNLREVAKNALSTLGEVYENSTVFEWIEEKIYPQLIRMEKFYNETKNLEKLRVWPKRPIEPIADLFRFFR
ncbi:hexosaminidase D-like protein, partial [Sarcoptes scabiei]